MRVGTVTPVLLAAAAGAALVATPVHADEDLFGPYFGTVKRVIDGDTFEAEVRIWPTIRAVVSVRVAGIDAPETFRPSCRGERELGDAARRLLETELPEGTTVRLENVTTDPFPGRVVAEVLRQSDRKGFPVKTLLLRHPDHVQSWSPGDPGIDWCEIWWRQKQLDLIR